MLRVVLIRPGSTEYDLQGRIQGTLNIPLSEEGSYEVLRLIEDLGDMDIDVLYTSSCQPALQTAERLAEALHLRLRRIDRLHNLNYGLWQGQLVSEVRRRQPKVYRQWQEQPETVCPPEGETIPEADERVRACLSKLIRRHHDGCIGLVVPVHLGRIVRRILRNENDLGDLWKATEDHGRWEILEVEPEHVRV